MRRRQPAVRVDRIRAAPASRSHDTRSQHRAHPGSRSRKGQKLMAQPPSRTSGSKTTAAKSSGPGPPGPGDRQGKARSQRHQAPASTQRPAAGQDQRGQDHAPAKTSAAKTARRPRPAAAKRRLDSRPDHAAKPAAAKSTAAKTTAAKSRAGQDHGGQEHGRPRAPRPARQPGQRQPGQCQPGQLEPGQLQQASASRRQRQPARPPAGPARARRPPRPRARPAAPRAARHEAHRGTARSAPRHGTRHDRGARPGTHHDRAPRGGPERSRHHAARRGARGRAPDRGPAPQRDDRAGSAAAADQTPAERRVRGKAARAEVPRESHAEWEPPPDRPDPVALLESQGAARVPDLVPVRYGRMMETPFTYYRGAALPMASDLATHPGHRDDRAGVRGRAPVQLRPLRLARAQAGLRRQRLRRDAARALGVGREAAGGQPGGGRAGERVQRQGPQEDRARLGRALPAGHAAAVRRGQPGRLVHPGGHRRVPGPVRRPAQGAPAQAAGQGPGQGPDPGQHAGAEQADPDRGRAAADRSRPAGHRPAPRPARRAGRGGRHREGTARPPRPVPADAAARPPGAARAVSSSPTWPARWSAWAAWAPAAGSS